MPIVRSKRLTSKQVHQALFPKRASRPRTVAQMKAGVRRYIRKRHTPG